MRSIADGDLGHAVAEECATVIVCQAGERAQRKRIGTMATFWRETAKEFDEILQADLAALRGTPHDDPDLRRRAARVVGDMARCSEKYEHAVIGCAGR